MKRKRLIISSIIFFLLVNTTYYWEGKLGGFAVLTFIGLIITYIFLAISLLRQITFYVKEKFEDKQRLLIIGLLSTILVLTFIYPSGLVNFEKFQSKVILIAQREGVANCMMTLKLRENRKFIDRSVCFGVTETIGDYTINKDTIFFDTDDYFKFGIIRREKEKNKKSLGELIMFKNHSDSTGITLELIKDETKQ